MAWGYKVPAFNVWGRVWRLHIAGTTYADRFYSGPYYTRCQVGASPFGGAFLVSFPKHSYLRAAEQTPFREGDLFQAAGWEYVVGRILEVYDKGAGFPNEHRVAQVIWWEDASAGSEMGLYAAAVNVGLEPPDGAEMLPLIPPFDDWQAPTEVEGHPPP